MAAKKRLGQRNLQKPSTGSYTWRSAATHKPVEKNTYGFRNNQITSKTSTRNVHKKHYKRGER